MLGLTQELIEADRCERLRKASRARMIRLARKQRVVA